MPDETETTMGGTPKKILPRTVEVKAHFAKMPKKKMVSDIWQKVIGAAIMFFAWKWMPERWPTLPAWASFMTFVVGAVAFGGELVQYPIKRVLGLIGDAKDKLPTRGGGE